MQTATPCPFQSAGNRPSKVFHHSATGAMVLLRLRISRANGFRSQQRYQVTVTVSDGTHSVQQAVSVTVTDISESTPNNPPSGLSSTGTLSRERGGRYGGRSIQCDRSGCRSGTDLSLGEWSRRRKHPYFGDERYAPRRGYFRLRIERFELCDPCTSQGRV